MAMNGKTKMVIMTMKIKEIMSNLRYQGKETVEMINKERHASGVKCPNQIGNVCSCVATGHDKCTNCYEGENPGKKRC